MRFLLILIMLPSLSLGCPTRDAVLSLDWFILPVGCPNPLDDSRTMAATEFEKMRQTISALVAVRNVQADDIIELELELKGTISVAERIAKSTRSKLDACASSLGEVEEPPSRLEWAFYGSLAGIAVSVLTFSTLDLQKGF